METLSEDPSTYPVQLIFGVVVTGMIGCGIHTLLHSKDVQIAPDKKNSIIRHWGNKGDEVGTKLALNLGSSDPEYEKIALGEGQGVDHEQWLKEKRQREEKDKENIEQFDPEYLDSVQAKLARIQRKKDEEDGLI